jgi:hypothetical protein
MKWSPRSCHSLRAVSLRCEVATRQLHGEWIGQSPVQVIANCQRGIRGSLVSDTSDRNHPQLYSLRNIDHHPFTGVGTSARLAYRAPKDRPVVVLSRIRSRDRGVTRCDPLVAPDCRRTRRTDPRKRRTGNERRKSARNNIFAMNEIATGIRWTESPNPVE